ncbi:conserved hypothetical protein [Rhizobium johnstonii 3841]|uniref:Uncharacterized protein n=1 Tax=Rhizobium johnstonii (strain DSM 114642 / LMG 32736 / 3841) TaxID=216596 RepID=Q1MD84_RHIJ3|nr:conserved hypothetical protein [Rhizobium johnstonii 3841]
MAGSVGRKTVRSRPSADDAAIGQLDRPIKKIQRTGIMGDNHDPGSPDVGNLPEKFDHLTAANTVECCGRLVGQDESWIVGQGTSNRDALLLAAGKP